MFRSLGFDLSTLIRILMLFSNKIPSTLSFIENRNCNTPFGLYTRFRVTSSGNSYEVCLPLLGNTLASCKRCPIATTSPASPTPLGNHVLLPLFPFLKRRQKVAPLHFLFPDTNKSHSVRAIADPMPQTSLFVD